MTNNLNENTAPINLKVTTLYKEHVFVSFDVECIRELLAEEEPEDFPKLFALSDDELDEHLRYCANKGFVIWNNDGGLDLYELENLIRE